VQNAFFYVFLTQNINHSILWQVVHICYWDCEAFFPMTYCVAHLLAAG